MGLGNAVRDAWRKNSAELKGVFDGALPGFVLSPQPPEHCGGVPVFCYHIVTREGFEADLRFLADNGYVTLGARQVVEFLAGRARVDGRPVMLTFDDGARNFHDVAFPLLAQHGARAVHFIAPGLHAESSRDAEGDERPMNWDELRKIHDSGLVEFQSHTYESRYVPSWPMPAALSGCDPKIEASRRGTPRPLREDLEASVDLLQRRLPGARVHQVAFPMYDGTSEAVEVARSLGFDACYWGPLPGRPVNRPGESPFHMSRVSDEFLRRLPGQGRIGLRALLDERLRRIRVAKAWRRQFGVA